jgi:hypothetical protein
MSSSKKITCKKTLREVFICQKLPPLLGFCLGWFTPNCIGSESGQIQSVKTSAEYVLQHNSTNPDLLPVTHCLYIMYFDTGRGGEGEPERRFEGAIVCKAGSKIPT